MKAARAEIPAGRGHALALPAPRGLPGGFFCLCPRPPKQLPAQTAQPASSTRPPQPPQGRAAGGGRGLPQKRGNPASHPSYHPLPPPSCPGRASEDATATATPLLSPLSRGNDGPLRLPVGVSHWVTSAPSTAPSKLPGVRPSRTFKPTPQRSERNTGRAQLGEGWATPDGTTTKHPA